ncbi:MAG: acyl-CoA dehydrogenase [Actinomycetota bacterium]|nr:acyl-CoA dehydrogenase [Actinomycetota bacterium]
MAVDQAVVDLMLDVFTQYRQAHPSPTPVQRDPSLWRSLGDLGLVRLTGSEPLGGSGAGWGEAAELIAAAVRCGVRLPLSEHDLLACWLLEATGLPVDDAFRTVCVLDPDGAASGVPWAAGADRIVTVWFAEGEYLVADLDAGALRITPGTNRIGEPRDTVVASLGQLRGTQVASETVEQLRLKSALIRSIQVCAALDRIVEMSIDHTMSRVQFGRPLSKFQAVQNLVSDMAAEAALARAATDGALIAAVASAWSAPNLRFLVAVARSCSGHAASVVVRNGHQVHGAIGTTIEHSLHEFTRSALTWRSEFGSVRFWDDQVTEAACRTGTADLWNLITE